MDPLQVYLVLSFCIFLACIFAFIGRSCLFYFALIGIRNLSLVVFDMFCVWLFVFLGCRAGCFSSSHCPSSIQERPTASCLGGLSRTIPYRSPRFRLAGILARVVASFVHRPVAQIFQ